VKKNVTKEELEKAHAVVAELEKALTSASIAARITLFADVQANMNERPIPKFSKGTTMSQAYRMGMDVGVTCTFEGLDNIGATIVDGKERILNVTMIENDIDLVPMVDLWADYINS